MPDIPRDGFETYFAEKLWEMIPSIYRHEDGLAERPGVLRALVEVLAEQAAILRRSHDRLWDDQFVELCDDWAVPYLADLLATRLVSALNKRGRRVDVAKTIYYRRRKGTLRVLEELTSDIAGWEGAVVEEFRRLARARHGLDPRPELLLGRISGTPPGGWADLRRSYATELAGGPLDEFYHTPDMRRHRGTDGRHNIPKLAFHLYRLRAFEVEGATPWQRAGGPGYTFDPSGRDVPLFMPRNRPQYLDIEPGQAAGWDAWHPAREWELPAPIRCRLLGQAEGKAALLPNALSVEEAGAGVVPPAQVTAGYLKSWASNASGVRLVVDPVRGRFIFLTPPPAQAGTVSYHYGFPGEIGAGPYARSQVEAPQRAPAAHLQNGGPITAALLVDGQVTQVDDSQTYGPLDNKSAITDLTLQAKNGQRPYLHLAADWVLDSSPNQEAKLVLDGLWLGSSGSHSVTLRGDYKQVTIQCCTFDPGGEDAEGNPIAPVSLVVEGNVEELVIGQSILGPVQLKAGHALETLILQDSIVQSLQANPALDVPSGEVHMERVTIFGALKVHRLWASEALITGLATVTDTQNGCFRFGAALVGSRLPRRYESHLFAEFGLYFTSQRFGDPGYAQLSQVAPPELQRGAENGSEIGAWSGLLNPIRLSSLQAKIDEYMPFGLIPIFVFET